MRDYAHRWATVSCGALLCAATVHAATLEVDDNLAQCPAAAFTSIQAAVNAAVAGDVINVCPGTYAAFGVISKTSLTIQSTAGAAQTFVTGYANGCYGIYLTNVDGVTLDGFDVAPMYPFETTGCDVSGIATSANNRNLAIRNNVIHDIMAPGKHSCSGSYGIIGMALNDIHDSVVEGNRFHTMNNVGCTPGTPAEVGAGTANIRFFSSAVQVIFASGSNSNPAPGMDLFEIRDNVIESGAGFNPLGIRIKRSENFAVTGNEVSGLANADGTPTYPSTSLGLNFQGAYTASIRGDVTGNTVAEDVGFDIETVNKLTVTGNHFGGTATTGLIRNGNDNYVCENVLGAAGVLVFDGTGPASTGNTFPGGDLVPGNFDCPPPPLDHFKCYDAKPPKHAPTPVSRVVELVDQFEAKTTIVYEATRLCNPVDKKDEGIADPTAHLTCYRIADAPGQPPFEGRTVLVENQFGAEYLEVGKPNRLCVPSEMNQVPSSLEVDHFKCYNARGVRPPLSPPMLPALRPKSLKLVDEFLLERVDIRKPVALCNPVDKNGEGLVNPEGHLVCYDMATVFEMPKFNGTSVVVTNQFGEEPLDVRTPRILCLPSTKTEVGLRAPQAEVEARSDGRQRGAGVRRSR